MRLNPLPAVDDLPGSALDAQVLALYVWLAASRYDEYRRNTVCLCIAESLSEAYVVASAGICAVARGRTSLAGPAARYPDSLAGMSASSNANRPLFF